MAYIVCRLVEVYSTYLGGLLWPRLRLGQIVVLSTPTEKRVAEMKAIHEIDLGSHLRGLLYDVDISEEKD